MIIDEEIPKQYQGLFSNGVLAIRAYEEIQTAFASDLNLNRSYPKCQYFKDAVNQMHQINTPQEFCSLWSIYGTFWQNTAKIMILDTANFVHDIAFQQLHKGYYEHLSIVSDMPKMVKKNNLFMAGTFCLSYHRAAFKMITDAM